MRYWVAGIDEAGRGPLAGPVVAAAVILDPDKPMIRGLRDSKQLSALQREQLAVKIRARALGFAVALASVEEIDRLNILQASLLAMKRALLALAPRPMQVLIDGNRAPCLDDCGAQYEVCTIIGGDDSQACISAASIIAKTYRDRLMAHLDQRYPGYGLSVHFGYGTPAHLEVLRSLGPSAIHRRSFAPVRQLLDYSAASVE